MKSDPTFSENGSNHRVLVVDGNRDGAEMMRRLLEARGYIVAITVDSTKTLECLHQFCPDVVLLNIAMTKVSGYELVEKIRVKPGFEETPILAISDYADLAHKARATVAGIDEHLIRPIELSVLETAIQNVIAKRGRSAISSCPASPATLPSITQFERQSVERRIVAIKGEVSRLRDRKTTVDARSAKLRRLVNELATLHLKLTQASTDGHLQFNDWSRLAEQRNF